MGITEDEVGHSDAKQFFSGILVWSIFHNVIQVKSSNHDYIVGEKKLMYQFSIVIMFPSFHVTSLTWHGRVDFLFPCLAARTIVDVQMSLV